MNASSECPERYKTGTIRALIHRAYKNASNWELFHASIKRVRQNLINSGYSNTIFDKNLNDYLDKIYSSTNSNDFNKIKHTIFYKNQYHCNYKTDEKVLKTIVKNNVKCSKPNEELKIQIYYKNMKTQSLIVCNNPHKEDNKLKWTNVIYQYKCKLGGCELLPNEKYIGFTTTTLSRRLTMHLINGAIKKHVNTNHQTNLSRDVIVENTEIIRKENNFYDLELFEAVMILRQAPTINAQDTGRIRKLLLLGSN